MGLEAVKEEVIRYAKEQETALLAEARREAGKIAKEAEKKVEEMKEKSEADFKKMAETIKRQATASAELENRKMILEAKKQIIDAVFAEAQKKLESLSDSKREAWMKKLLEKAGKEFGIAHVYCNKKDAKLVKGLNAEPAAIIGGLIAENREKTIRIDYSFETFLETIKNNELQNVNKLLFG